jgi:hypothetical protein
LQDGWCPRCAAGSPGTYPSGEYPNTGQARPEQEVLRLAERRAAMTRAAGWSVPFAVVMLLSAYVVAGIARSRYIESELGVAGGYSPVPHPPPPYLLWLLLAGTACWAACGAAEVLLARALAGDYPKLGPWAWVPESTFPQTVRGVLGGIDRKLGNAGGGCLAVVVLALVGPVVVIGWSMTTAWAVPLWVLALLGATAVHLLTVRSRLRTWHGRRRAGADA